MLLHHEFDAQAVARPTATALHFGAHTINYADLLARANGVATLLHSQGVSKGYVGLHMERSIHYVVALLGILKTGSAVVPLSPSYPESRRREILRFAELDAVVTAEPGAVPHAEARIIDLSGESLASEPPRVDQDPDSPAFVLSSSGSTGRPKMIVRSHRSFFHRLRWTWDQHPYGPEERCVQKSHMTTTHAIYELFEPLLRGVPLHLVSDEDVRNLEGFWEFIMSERITRLLAVPSMLTASLEAPSFVAPSFKSLVLMGEHVTPTLAQRVVEIFPRSTQVYSIYGSTEASSTLVCDIRHSLRPGEELPLGEPIAGDIDALVLDEHLRPVEAGNSGMLYIAGPALFSGYYKDPELTKSVLVSSGPRTLYRTQDRVQLSQTGELQFIGRVDDVVKIRGFRVELKEVEREIARHPNVAQCAVLTTGDAGASVSLIAFVTPASVRSRDLLENLREKLPSHMVPAAVISLDVLPLSASGKLDRRRLLAEYALETRGGESFASRTEEEVARAWRATLGHARFLRDSSFFEAGGTSLSTFALVSEMRSRFGLDRTQLSDATIYRYQTIAGQSTFVDAIRRGSGVVPTDSGGIIVSLKRGTKPELPPLFFIASAGGTLGAYAKLVAALGNDRDLFGVRDPFLSGDRDPAEGFGAWVERYKQAILAQRARGPYHLVAYSSAGALGYEIARLLLNQGHEVGALVLIDPVGMDRGSRLRYGHWAMEARFRGQSFQRLVRILGFMLNFVPRRVLDHTAKLENSGAIDGAQLTELAERARRNCGHIRRVAALMQLNTGLPFSLDPAEVAKAGPSGCMQLLRKRFRQLTPDADVDVIEKLVVQYELQVLAQRNYRLRKYDGDVSVIEPTGPHVGLEPTQIRTFVNHLRHWVLPVAVREHSQSILDVFPEQLATHYICMRDDLFVQELTKLLEQEIINPSL